MRTCRTCNLTKPLAEFATSGKWTLYKCRECHLAAERVRNRTRDRRGRKHSRQQPYAQRKAALTPEKWAENIARVKAWKQNNSTRAQLIERGWIAVRGALARGELVRPETCEFCGKSGLYIGPAHYDYSQPLSVRWLCRPCHRLWDAHEPKSKETAA
jgi:hypothetical protein